MALFAIAALVVLLKAWQGWRLGIVRQLASLGALALASICGLLAAPAMGVILRPFLPLPEKALAPLGGLLLGLVLYVAIGIVCAILFKKTGDQKVTLVRVGYGLAGAVVGAVYGVMLVWAFAVGLRLLGVVAETKLAVEKNPHFGGQRPTRVGSLASRLAELKKALEAGTVGSMLHAVDPLPETTYATFSKMATVASNAKAMERMIAYPGVKPVMDHPKVVALLSDPEVNKAITERRYLSLLSNAHLVAAADDPEVAARLREIDFQKALDYALRERGQKAEGRSQRPE